jgi:hypothetical protein
MMQRKILYVIFSIASITLLFSVAVRADVLAPPANQQLGISDGVFNNLLEADCRVCHEDPNIVSGGEHIPNRHHLLMNSPIQTGECSVNSNSCLSGSDCDSGICSRSNTACSVDADCPEEAFGEVCGEICIGETVAKDIDSDNNGVNDTTFACLNCHTVSIVGGIIEMVVWRDCTECHVQIPGEASIHHLLSVAQGTNSPLGDPDVGDCTPCHGTLVDDIGDGHVIPTYAPSLVTPSLSGGEAAPLNSRGNGAGACDYCHDSGTDTVTGIEVLSNTDTHHNTGVFQSEIGLIDFGVCDWCHNMSLPDESKIRACEGCHGYESLHNIQVDSSNPDNLGVIDVGAEAAGYGHIGNNDDCWGCHGFLQANAPGTGPITPFINGSDVLSMTAGTDTAVTLTGAAFTNLFAGFNWTSSVVLTAADSSSVTLIPDSITGNQLTVTVPGTTATGNYKIRAEKGIYAASNPVVISVKPEVAITDTDCDRKKGVLTINGSGFGEKPAGTDAYINAELNGQSVEIMYWSDTQIRASVSRCSNNATITVNALYGSATNGDSGSEKPDKPCKGKKC